jgi:hypothetical protein
MRRVSLLALLLAVACAPRAAGTSSCTWLVDCAARCSTDDCLNGCAEQASPLAIRLYAARANCEGDAGCVSPRCVQERCPGYAAACSSMDPGTPGDGGP